MSRIYDFTIALNPSRDFQRLGTILHGLAAILVCYSSLSIAWMAALLILLFTSWEFTRRIKTPCPQYAILSRRPPHWVLQNHQDQTDEFDDLSIAFNGGFFLVLTLKSTQAVKRLILFNDQITLHEQRMLFLSLIKS